MNGRVLESAQQVLLEDRAMRWVMQSSRVVRGTVGEHGVAEHNAGVGEGEARGYAERSLTEGRGAT